MASKFGGTSEICPVCSEKVYPLDRFVIEKMVIHKACFKCKHCGGKLGLSNFAAVNQQVYCKTHYLQLFRESGGRYDKAFGDGGFEKKSTDQSYVPGQFKGVGAPATPPSASTSPAKPSPVAAAGAVAAVAEPVEAAPPSVKEMMKKFNEPASPAAAAEVSPAAKSPAAETSPSPPSSGSRVKDMMKRFQKGGEEEQSELNTSSESLNSSRVSASGAASSSSLSERIKLYSANASSTTTAAAAGKEQAAVGSSAAGPAQGVGKLADRLQQYVSTAKEGDAKHQEAAGAEEEVSVEEEAPVVEEEAPVVEEEAPAVFAEEEHAAAVEEEEETPAAVEEEQAPAVEEEQAPVEEEEAPVDVEEEAPVVVEEEAPVVVEEEEQAPAVEEEEQAPVAVEEEQAPVEEEEAPVDVEEETPVVVEEEEQAPVVVEEEEEQAPVVVEEEEEQAPVVVEEEEQAPVVAEEEEQAPAVVEEEQAPAVEEETPVEDEPTPTEEAAPVAEEEPVEEDEEETSEQQHSTPIKERSSVEEEPRSIMKRDDSFRTPGDDRSVRFGGAVEVMEEFATPDGKSANDDGEEEEDDNEEEEDDTATYTPIERVRSSSGHSATKGSALALYLNIMDQQTREVRQQRQEERSPTPPPPLLSPGSHHAPLLEADSLVLSPLAAAAAAAAAAEASPPPPSGTMNLGALLPDYEVDTTQGKLQLHQYFSGGWGMLFSHPADFTPVCTTELRIAGDLFDEFASRQCKLLALSCDSVESHLEWIKDLGPGEFPFPIIADESREMATRLGMLDAVAKDQAGIPLTARAVFVFGPDLRLKLSVLYPATTGRNFYELVRALDSLQLTSHFKLATPVEWKQGDDCLVLAGGGDEFEVRSVALPSGKDYIQYTPDPSAMLDAEQLAERHVSFCAPGHGEGASGSNTGLNLGDALLDFTAESTQGSLTFSDLFAQGTKWVAVFCHPVDFAPVCTTELLRLAELEPEFAKRNCSVVAIACDSVESHQQWVADVEALGGSCKVGFPVVADESREIVAGLGMGPAVSKDESGSPPSHTARAVMLCSPDRKLKLSMLYPASTGRNMLEVVRALDSLQLTSQHRLATPGNWKQGNECIVASSVTEEEARELFPSGVRVEDLPSGKAYLRFTDQPQE